jgi:gas vesicle protein
MSLLALLEEEAFNMVTELDYMNSKRGLAVGSLLIGVLIGAVVGGVTALLLAPSSGRETRQMLKGKAQETQQMLQERLSSVKEKVGQVTESMRSRAEQEMHSVDAEK